MSDRRLRDTDLAARSTPLSRESVYEESICVAIHLLDHKRVAEARDELLGALPYRLTKTYRNVAEQAAEGDRA